MFDVKASEAGLPLIFDIPGLSDVTAINAHARVQLKQVEVQDGMLPIAVPDLRFTYVFATFVNEVTGAALGTVQLTKTGTSGANQLWTTPTPISFSIPSAHVGVRLRLVGGSDPQRGLRDALHGVLRHSIRRTGSSTSAAGARGPRRRRATSGCCPARACRMRTSRRATAAPASRPRSTSAPLYPLPAPALPQTCGRASTATDTSR